MNELISKCIVYYSIVHDILYIKPQVIFEGSIPAPIDAVDGLFAPMLLYYIDE
jgi:hypothetical protein